MSLWLGLGVSLIAGWMAAGQGYKSLLIMVLAQLGFALMVSGVIQ